MQVDKDFGVMQPPAQADETVSREGALQSGSGRGALPDAVTIDYTNYRGERGIRRIVPQQIEFGSNEWHPEPQWLLKAWDCEKKAERLFSLGDIHRWMIEEATTEPTRTAPGDGSQHDTNLKLEEAKEIIRFYANPETYHALVFMGDSPCGAFADDFSDDHGDEVYDRKMPGARARSFLKENGE